MKLIVMSRNLGCRNDGIVLDKDIVQCASRTDRPVVRVTFRRENGMC